MKTGIRDEGGIEMVLDIDLRCTGNVALVNRFRLRIGNEQVGSLGVVRVTLT
jgi:hypothetical protein